MGCKGGLSIARGCVMRLIYRLEFRVENESAIWWPWTHPATNERTRHAPSAAIQQWQKSTNSASQQPGLYTKLNGRTRESRFLARCVSPLLVVAHATNKNAVVDQATRRQDRVCAAASRISFELYQLPVVSDTCFGEHLFV